MYYNVIKHSGHLKTRTWSLPVRKFTLFLQWWITWSKQIRIRRYVNGFRASGICHTVKQDHDNSLNCRHYFGTKCSVKVFDAAILDCNWMDWGRVWWVGWEMVQKCALTRLARQKYSWAPSPFPIFAPNTYFLDTFFLATTLHSYQIQDGGLIRKCSCNSHTKISAFL